MEGRGFVDEGGRGVVRGSLRTGLRDPKGCKRGCALKKEGVKEASLRKSFSEPREIFLPREVHLSCSFQNSWFFLHSS
jgi:hypothetical protein